MFFFIELLRITSALFLVVTNNILLILLSVLFFRINIPPLTTHVDIHRREEKVQQKRHSGTSGDSGQVSGTSVVPGYVVRNPRYQHRTGGIHLPFISQISPTDI